MQNKNKLPKDVRIGLTNMLKGLDRRKKKIKDAEREICSGGGGARIRANINGEDRYIYLPSGGASATSGVERQADALIKLHESFDYRFIKAVERADHVVRAEMKAEDVAPSVRDKVIAQIYNSFKAGRKFNYYRTDLDINGISFAKFYRLRSDFLYEIAKILKMI